MSHILEGLDQSPPKPNQSISVDPEAYSNETEGSQNGRPHFERFPMRIVTILVHRDVPELVRNMSDYSVNLSNESPPRSSTVTPIIVNQPESTTTAAPGSGCSTIPPPVSPQSALNILAQDLPAKRVKDTASCFLTPIIPMDFATLHAQASKLAFDMAPRTPSRASTPSKAVPPHP